MRPFSAALSGTLAALAATAIWSGNIIVARGLAEVVPPATLALCRWTTAFAAIAPLALPTMLRQREVLKKHFRYLLFTAVLGVTIFNTLIYLAGRHTPALNLALMCTFIPAFLLLLSRLFLGEALTPTKLAGLVVAVVGVALLLSGGDPAVLRSLRLNPGDLWMLLAALIFAAYSILVRKRPQGISRLALLGTSFGLGALLLIPWAAVEQLLGLATSFPPAAIGSILYIGLGASLASYWLWNIALDRIGPTRAGFIYYTLPLFSGLEAAWLLDEPVSWVHAASGVLIIGGIFTATMLGKPRR